ncbi:hypothetical protein K490DRAFT_58887 [Saccharata proteae CBS 121410]|uniref:Uncharacterized protein n=1 Tax=Saccharata proteae CBS 121410 TaxID=1314787 RepID=A0A9P4LXS2_9PEZI|nr:hypothetical protein K490DRAFT_58887 [Saccharata proteae CBS 121410]
MDEPSDLIAKCFIPLCIIAVLLLLALLARITSSRAITQAPQVPLSQSSALNHPTTFNDLIIDVVHKAAKNSEEQTAAQIRQFNDEVLSRMDDFATSLQIVTTEARSAHLAAPDACSITELDQKMTKQASKISKLVKSHDEMGQRTELMQHLLETNKEYQKNEFEIISQKLSQLELAFKNQLHTEVASQSNRLNKPQKSESDGRIAQDEPLETLSLSKGQQIDQTTSIVAKMSSINADSVLNQATTDMADINSNMVREQVETDATKQVQQEGKEEDHLDEEESTESRQQRADREMSDFETFQKELQKIVEEGKKENATLSNENVALRSRQQTMSAELQTTQDQLQKSQQAREADIQAHTESQGKLEHKLSEATDKLSLKVLQHSETSKKVQKIQKEKLGMRSQMDQLWNQIQRHEADSERFRFQLHATFTKLRSREHEFAQLQLEKASVQAEVETLRSQLLSKVVEIDSALSQLSQKTSAYKQAVRQIQIERRRTERMRRELLKSELAYESLEQHPEKMENSQREQEPRMPHPSKPDTTHPDTGASDTSKEFRDATKAHEKRAEAAESSSKQTVNDEHPTKPPRGEKANEEGNAGGDCRDNSHRPRDNSTGTTAPSVDASQKRPLNTDERHEDREVPAQTPEGDAAEGSDATPPTASSTPSAHGTTTPTEPCEDSSQQNQRTASEGHDEGEPAFQNATEDSSNTSVYC